MTDFENFRMKHIDDVYICIDNYLFHEYFDGNHKDIKYKKMKYFSDSLIWRMDVIKTSDVFQRENLLRNHFQQTKKYLSSISKEYIELFRQKYEIQINIEISLLYDEKCSQNLCKPLNNEEYEIVMENMVFDLAIKSFIHFDDLITKIVLNKNLFRRIDFDIKSLDMGWRNREGDNVMHILSIIGDLENLEYFMKKYEDNIYDKTIEGYTIMTLAMKNGHKHIKDCLIQKNINHIKMRWSHYKNKNKRSLYPNLLLKHCCFDEARIMESYMMTKMITVKDMYFIFEPYDETPLHFILSLGRIKCLTSLINRGYVTEALLYKKNKFNRTPIDIMHENTKTIIEYFLETQKSKKSEKKQDE